ncbi:hypothetical protein E1B28_002101 [Marasmius oreades]|uniref:Zn(2)-C6 fungal-type domain-containing protein n=1 Tax=Marasmius oreades TaxID=181124 RepID=A0A9P7RMF1_9AGAR|nr:uncharacterized protein E1B28_002101 [Marasmius oreades]KAG7086142.1 hypothetical protein E1B28_002101 [Marasmius oreades]
MSTRRTLSRPIQSCFQCRKRKIRCNRSHPCAPCLLRGEGDVCHEVERNIARAIGPGVTVEAVEQLVTRVGALERSATKLAKLMAQGSSRTEFIHCAAPQKTALTSPQQVASKVRQPACTESEEGAAIILAQLAMGNPIPPPSSNRIISPNANGLPKEHPLSLLVQPSTSVIPRILSHLPDGYESRSLVRTYFDRIEWYTRIFHYPTFSYEVEIMASQISDSSASPESYDTPAAPRISLPFLSTYFMVLCLAYHFIEPEMCKVLGITFAEAAEKSKKMYNAAQLCLWVDNYGENHSLEGVQTLILMGIYQQNIGDSDSHWALLGSAIKIAQNLGIDRLGTEYDRKTYLGPWKSVVRREVGRRVWWNLIHNEWSNAATHHGSYSIIPSQNRTGLPLNVNDIDLQDDFGPIEQAPHTKYTEMTYSLMRFRIQT